MKRFFIPALCLICSFLNAQEKTGTRTFINRDNLTRYYKAAVNANFLTKENGEYTFSASWFGIRKIFGTDSLTIDTLYLSERNRKHRNLNIELKFIPGESSFLESFEPELSYALINNRDATERNREEYQSVDDFGQLMNRVLLNTVTEYQRQSEALANPSQREERQKILQEFQRKWNEEEVKLQDMDSVLREIFEKEMKAQKKGQLSDLATLLTDFPEEEVINHGIYDELWAEAKDRISRKGLLKVSLGSKFESNGLNGGSIGLSYLKGLNPNQTESSPLDIEAKTSFNLERDSISEGSSELNRSRFVFEGNLNKVLLKRRKGEGEESVMELKAGVDYTRITEGVYVGEEAEAFNFKAVLSIRLTKDLYIPLTVKYDPEDSNVLGFLKIEYNIGDTDEE
jgi:hypothetical protein